MLKRIAELSLIAAMLLVMGTHWIFLQSIAWSTMLADNLRHESFSAAVQRTFDGNHPCCLCKQIAKGKHSESKSEVRGGWQKLEFSYSAGAIVICAPTKHWQIQPQVFIFASLTHSPAVPPPRQFPA